MTTPTPASNLDHLSDRAAAVDVSRWRLRTNLEDRRRLIGEALGAGISLSAIATALKLSRNALYKAGVPDATKTTRTKAALTELLEANAADRIELEKRLSADTEMRIKLIKRIVAEDPDIATASLAKRSGLRATRVQEIRRGDSK